VQRGGISLLFLVRHSSEARAVGWFPGPSGALDLVDAYRDSRSALTMQREKDNITSWPHSGSSVALAQKFFLNFFARERLIEQETRHELDSAHQYVATRPEEYSKFV